MPSRTTWAWRSLGQLLRVAEGRGVSEGRSTKAEVWRLVSQVLINIITMANRIAQIELEQVRAIEALSVTRISLRVKRGS
jgi:KaiC/GvpD/RAD55 family RecA-like ATPase